MRYATFFKPLDIERVLDAMPFTSRSEKRKLQEEQRNEKARSTFDPAIMCQIILVRHGETQWNVEKRLQGQLYPGPPLNDRGLSQTKLLAQHLQDTLGSIQAVYASDLLRCTQTAQSILKASDNRVIPLILKEELRERDLGVLTGLRRDDAPNLEPEAYRALVSHNADLQIPGGGESLQQLTKRAENALERIAGAHKGEQIVVVSHGGFMNAAYNRAKGTLRGARSANCSLGVLQVQGKSWLIESWNHTSHLKDVGCLQSAFGGGTAG